MGRRLARRMDRRSPGVVNPLPQPPGLLRLTPLVNGGTEPTAREAD